MPTPETIQEAIATFRRHNGILRTAEALRLGIHPRTLYWMRDAGLLERLARGLYRQARLSPMGHPDLVTVALKVTDAVICLVSALAFHELTTQIPHAIDIALPAGSRRPRLDNPRLRVFWFSGEAWSEGVETHLLDGIPVHITGPAKSVADIFKYRGKLGLDIALEALRRFRNHPSFSVDELLHYARVCRVEDVIRPYLESLL